MNHAITFTLDLEDPRPDSTHPPRHIEVVHRVLDHFASINTRGTVFVVGEVAEQSPSLIQKISELGMKLPSIPHTMCR